jgi:23S rRNA (cytosine1962-C5)-methyltransferase
MDLGTHNSYQLLDSGAGLKLEQFGPYRLSRPCAQAVWKPLLPKNAWLASDAVFTRENDLKWQNNSSLPEAWTINAAGLKFKISPTDFGHLGLFPEQQDFWEWLPTFVTPEKERLNILNLFAYSGGSTLAAANCGAAVCHLDASKGMVSWARENALLNNLQDAPIRWIVDDVHKFLARELRRGMRYDGIILDPPTFGRGAKGELFKIEEDLSALLETCRTLLSSQPRFLFFSCHSPGFTPIVMHHLMQQLTQGLGGVIHSGEMLLRGHGNVLPVPSGAYARWACV